MGCGYSSTKEGEQSVKATFSRLADNLRSERKLPKINERLQPEHNGKLLENVTIDGIEWGEMLLSSARRGRPYAFRLDRRPGGRGF